MSTQDKLWRSGGVDLASCPYYRGVGKCESGCREEPSCITDEPLKGWPSLREKLALPAPPVPRRDEMSEPLPPLPPFHWDSKRPEIENLRDEVSWWRTWAIRASMTPAKYRKMIARAGQPPKGKPMTNAEVRERLGLPPLSTNSITASEMDIVSSMSASPRSHSDPEP